jgi:fibronectin type III domain protein
VKNNFWAILLVASLFVPGFGQAAGNTRVITSSTVTITWNKFPDRRVKGYRLHYGLTYSTLIDVGNVTTYTVSNLTPEKTYYCIVTAYYASGKESRPSNEISFTTSPSPDRVRPTFGELDPKRTCDRWQGCVRQGGHG